MIGVVARDSDLAIVREFFELFKTPWEPYRGDRRYPVVVAVSPEESLPDANLSVIYGLDPKARSGRSGKSPAPEALLLGYRGTCFPVYGGCSNPEGSGKAVITRQDTGKVVGLETEGRSGKTVRIGYDLIGEVRFLLSSGQPVQYARVPTLEFHISVLRELILDSGLPLVEIPPVPPGYKWILCLTHDVDFVSIRAHRLDRTVIGFLHRATIGSLLRFLKGQLPFAKLVRNFIAVLSLPLIHLGLARDFFNQFDRYLQLEGSHRSTFFVIPCKNVDGRASNGRNSRGRAVRYDVGDISHDIAALLAKGCEVGLHGIDAWHNLRKAKEERAMIEQATGMDTSGVRIHWLFFSKRTSHLLEEAGFSYDSTWGYNDRVGFRGGTTQVFRPPGAKRLLELPLHIQDTALFSTGRMNLSPDKGIGAIEDLVGKARETGGVLAVNWHMRSLGPERYWDDPYRYLLRLAEQGSAWAATARDVVGWFALRRSVEFSKVDLEGRANHVFAEKSESVPGLLLRLYNFSTNTTKDVIDIPFSGSIDYSG